MFAIIEFGGRQLKVGPGAVVRVDHTGGAPGDEITFDKVLMVSREGGEIVAGEPYVAGARVVGVVEGESRGPKIRVFKKKRRKGMRRTRGHRSVYTRVSVRDIVA